MPSAWKHRWRNCQKAMNTYEANTSDGPGGEPVESVGEVHRVRGRREHEEHPDQEEHAERERRGPDERQVRRDAGLRRRPRHDRADDRPRRSPCRRTSASFVRPSERRLRTFMKSSRNPTSPNPSGGEHERDAGGREPVPAREPGREVGSTSSPIRMTMPPIVGRAHLLHVGVRAVLTDALTPPPHGEGADRDRRAEQRHRQPIAPATRIEITAAPPRAVRARPPVSP